MKVAMFVWFLIFSCILTLSIGVHSGLIRGKQRARDWHCHSQGYQEYTVTERGTIQCIKITRETIR